MLLLQIARLLTAIALAFCAGKLAARLKMPAILGWLIAGMALGPHALNLLNQQVLDSAWFGATEHVLECVAGLLIGTELLWNKLRKAGRQILVTTITESLGTFVTVSLVFALVFRATGTPVYLALLFGGIALATAPAPSLSIVNELKTHGPVTRTLMPMAALDDLVAAVVFFTVTALVSARISDVSLPVAGIMVLVFLPVPLGACTGFVTAALMRRARTPRRAIALMAVLLLATAGLGFAINSLLPVPVLNFMLLGMAFSTAVANRIPAQLLDQVMKTAQPVIGLALVVVILNLGAPLDYHLIFGAGAYTVVYILARALGKYGGAYLGAATTGAPATMRKFLGFTLLPHSGMSLVFTGIAVSVLSGPAPECASILQGTIAAAAVINEVIAVFMAKKGFEWAGELPAARKEVRA